MFLQFTFVPAKGTVLFRKILADIFFFNLAFQHIVILWFFFIKLKAFPSILKNPPPQLATANYEGTLHPFVQEESGQTARSGPKGEAEKDRMPEARTGRQTAERNAFGPKTWGAFACSGKDAFWRKLFLKSPRGPSEENNRSDLLPSSIRLSHPSSPPQSEIENSSQKLLIDSPPPQKPPKWQLEPFIVRKSGRTESPSVNKSEAFPPRIGFETTNARVVSQQLGPSVRRRGGRGGGRGKRKRFSLPRRETANDATTKTKKQNNFFGLLNFIFGFVFRTMKIAAIIQWKCNALSEQNFKKCHSMSLKKRRHFWASFIRIFKNFGRKTKK